MRGIQGGERFVDLDRVGVEIDGAQDARVCLWVIGKPPQAACRSGPRRATRVGDTAPVEVGAAAIQAYADSDAGGGERCDGTVCQQGAVGLHAGVHFASGCPAVHGVPHGGGALGQEGWPGE